MVMGLQSESSSTVITQTFSPEQCHFSWSSQLSMGTPLLLIHSALCMWNGTWFYRGLVKPPQLSDTSELLLLVPDWKWTEKERKSKWTRVCMPCRFQIDSRFSIQAPLSFTFELLSSSADLRGETQTEQCILGIVARVAAFIKLMQCWTCFTYNDPFICQQGKGLALDYINKTEGIC